MAHRILYNSKKITYVDNELYYYLQREGSIMSKVSYKRKVDLFLSQSDRMRYCNTIGVDNISNRLAKEYEYKFLKLYLEIENNSDEKQDILLKELRRDLILNMKIILKSKDKCLKEKIWWIGFAISPKIYQFYKKCKI